MMIRTLLMGVGILASPIAITVPSTASAAVLQSAQNGSLCIDWNTSTNKVALFTCQNSYNQNFFSSAYGVQTTRGLCLDAPTQGGDVVMTACNGKPSQKWSLVSDNSAPGAMRNEAGYCIDIPGGNAYSGQRLQAWTCKWGIDWTRANQVWTRGNMASAAAVAGRFNVSVSTLQAAPAGSVFNASGKLIAAGGGNVIGTDGSSLIAAGGGNLIAAGGGNFNVADGGGVHKSN